MPGSAMLVFFGPPKCLKPKSGVLAILITEAREASPLEMPESHENTLVIKTESLEVPHLNIRDIK